MSNHGDLVTQFISITGADQDQGWNALEATNWNLEQAVQLFFENGPVTASKTSKTNSKPSPQTNMMDYEDDIRAPIPQFASTLYDDEGGSGPGIFPPLPQQIRDMFRDYDTELRNLGRPKKEDGMSQLFKPPTDIIQKGSFDKAKQKCLDEGKWLLVNIQNTQEFDSHKLNRDTWSNSLIKNLVKTFFIFWQQQNDTIDGQRFQQFYKVYTTPHIAIIDPRTGERVKAWNGYVTAEDLADTLTSFIDKYSVLDHKNLPPSITSKPEESNPDFGVADMDNEENALRAAIEASLSDAPKLDHIPSVVPKSKVSIPISSKEEKNHQLTEDEELALAIAASLEPQQTKVEKNQPKPTTVSQPQPVVEQPKPTTVSQPQPKSQPIVEQPKPTTVSQPQPKPQPVAEQPKPEPVAEPPKPVFVPKKSNIDTKKYVVTEGNPPETTRLQLKFPDGKREVVRFKLESPLAVIYEVYREKIGEEAKTKNFKVIFLEKSMTLEDSETTTIKDTGIANASLQIKWED